MSQSVLDDVMDQIQHSDMVAALAKSGEAITAEMTPTNWAVLKGAVFAGIAAGEHLDKAKKQVVYNKDMGLSARPDRFMPQVSPEQSHLLHMALGIFGEAAELLEAITNHVIHGDPLDLENVVEELGDGEFYQEGLRQGLGISREDTLTANIQKLGVRYEGLCYSDEAAQARADKP